MANISNYATAQAKVPMRQVTFSSAESKQQIKRKKKSHGNVYPKGRPTFKDSRLDLVLDLYEIWVMCGLYYKLPRVGEFFWSWDDKKERRYKRPIWFELLTTDSLYKLAMEVKLLRKPEL